MALRIGDLAADKVYVGSSPVDKVYVGSELVWTAFTAMGMSKSGKQVISTNSRSDTANTITGWTPLSAYPGTVITNDALVMSESGNVSITVTVTISTAGGTSHSRGIHLRIDGANVATDSTTVGSQTSFSATYTGAVTAGQRIGLAAWVQTATAGYRNLTAAQIVVTPAS